MDFKIRLEGTLLNEEIIKLEGYLSEQIILSENIVLHDSKFVLSFPINFIQKKK